MRIALLGDMAFFGVYSVNNNPRLKEQLREITDYLAEFDLVVGNFESPLSILKKTNGAKSAYLSSDVENVEILRWLHVNAVNLANNHLYDYGSEGFETTIKELDRLCIGHFGTNGEVWKFTKDDNNILFSGYCCYSTNPLRLAKKQGGKGINKYNVRDVEQMMKKNVENGFLNIVAVHAGTEHVNYPSLDHVRAARRLAETCPYIYYGHHPHVIQGVEEYKGALIAHSLGNFCFDDTYTDTSGDKPLVVLTEQNRTGMILEVTIEANKVVDWKETPIYIGREGKITLLENSDFLKEYNKGLVNCEDNLEEYATNRQKVINARIAERKAMRNFSWVVKRLRPRFVRLIFDMKENSKLYKKNVRKYI